MKTVGSLDGMNWEITLTHYRAINEVVKNRLGDLNRFRLSERCRERLSLVGKQCGSTRSPRIDWRASHRKENAG